VPHGKRRSPDESEQLPTGKMDKDKFSVGTLLKLPSFDEARQFQLKKFWQERGFTFALTDSNLLLARRGSFVQTLFSMNPQVLETKLTATWSEAKELECLMEINLFLQQVTEWHKAFLELEMITFENYMLHDDKKSALWREFNDDMQIANLQYLWTFGLGGKKMPDQMKRKYLNR